MYIIMLGAPGSGKGTIGKEICKKYNLTHLSTGDIFRDEIKRGTDLGKKANEYTSSRVLCSNKECGATFNTIFMPPKVEGICDVCGSKLIVRDDDKPETIRERLNVYYKNTEPLIDFYKNEGTLESIDIDIYSSTTKEDTTSKAVEIIEAKLK